MQTLSRPDDQIVKFLKANGPLMLRQIVEGTRSGSQKWVSRRLTKLIERGIVRRLPNFSDMRMDLFTVPKGKPYNVLPMPIRYSDDPRILFWMKGVPYDKDTKIVEPLEKTD